METAKHIIIVSALVLFATGVAISEESQISNTRQASCIVEIITQEDVLPLNSGDINSLIRSSAVFGKAVNEVLGHAPDNILNGLKVTGRHAGNEITYNFELNVHLPDAVKPAANEFVKALVENLGTNLDDLYKTYRLTIDGQLGYAQSEYKEAESQLEAALKSSEAKQSQNKYVITYGDLSEADKKVYEQLEKTVSLPKLSPGTSFGQVLEIMANSVQPPLQIQPNWRNLADYADILPTTACEMNSLRSVKIGKGMDILMTHMSNDLANIDYVVQGGVIVIATEGTLPSDFVTMVYDVAGLIGPSQSVSSIKSSTEKTVEPASWYDTDDTGEGKIDIIVGNQLSIYQTPEIQQKIQKFLDSIPIEITTEPVTNIPIARLNNEKQDFSNKKQTLEMDVASLKARRKAIEERIRTIGSQSTLRIKDDPITKELEQLLDNENQRMEQIKLQIEHNVAPRSAVVDEEDKLSRLKIELAKRREELGNTAGREQLTTLNNDLSNTMIDLAGKEAELNEIEKQLSSIQSQIKAASTTDPVLLKVRQAREALEEAENRVNELKAKEKALQPPQIIVIGIE